MQADIDLLQRQAAQSSQLQGMVAELSHDVEGLQAELSDCNTAISYAAASVDADTLYQVLRLQDATFGQNNHVLILKTLQRYELAVGRGFSELSTCIGKSHIFACLASLSADICICLSVAAFDCQSMMNGQFHVQPWLLSKVSYSVAAMIPHSIVMLVGECHKIRQ